MCLAQGPQRSDAGEAPFSGREETDHRNYFIINLHQSMGPGRDRTRDPWICSQTRICSQTLPTALEAGYQNTDIIMISSSEAKGTKPTSFHACMERSGHSTLGLCRCIIKHKVMLMIAHTAYLMHVGCLQTTAASWQENLSAGVVTKQSSIWTAE